MRSSSPIILLALRRSNLSPRALPRAPWLWNPLAKLRSVSSITYLRRASFSWSSFVFSSTCSWYFFLKSCFYEAIMLSASFCPPSLSVRRIITSPSSLVLAFDCTRLCWRLLISFLRSCVSCLS